MFALNFFSFFKNWVTIPLSALHAVLEPLWSEAKLVFCRIPTLHALAWCSDVYGGRVFYEFIRLLVQLWVLFYFFFGVCNLPSLCPPPFFGLQMWHLLSREVLKKGNFVCFLAECDDALFSV